MSCTCSCILHMKHGEHSGQSNVTGRSGTWLLVHLLACGGRSCIFNVRAESISNITKHSKDMIEA
jgi:hypothetical protein